MPFACINTYTPKIIIILNTFLILLYKCNNIGYYNTILGNIYIPKEYHIKLVLPSPTVFMVM